MTGDLRRFPVFDAITAFRTREPVWPAPGSPQKSGNIYFGLGETGSADLLHTAWQINPWHGDTVIPRTGYGLLGLRRSPTTA